MVGTVSKVPLAYVIRDHEDPLPEAAEPPFGDAGSPFASFSHELVARAPIYHVAAGGARTMTHYFTLDRVVIWKLLYQICHGTIYYSYIRQYQQSRDGRAAYFALYTALLGTQAVSNYASTAENKLQSLSLTGQKTKNWGFEKYVLQHMDQHTILEKLKEHGHSGIDETSKIRHFSRGITDPEMETVKSSVSANIANLDTFDKVVATYRTFIESKKHFTKDTKININVSSLGSNPTRGGSGNRTQTGSKTGAAEDGFDPSNNYDAHKCDTNRYYQQNEWNSLTKGQRNYMRQNSRGANKRKGGRPSNRNASEVKTSVLKSMMKEQKAMKATIASLETQVAVDGLDSDDNCMIIDSDSDEPAKKKKKKSILRVPRKNR
jgi:hypothetical protein